VPPGVVPFPGFTNLGSRIWTSDERESQPALGELNSTRHQWFKGTPPDPYPVQRLVGNAACLIEGESGPCPTPLPEPSEVLTANCLSDLPDTLYVFFPTASGMFAGLQGQEIAVPRDTPGLFGWFLSSANTYGLPGALLNFTIGCDSGGVVLWLQNPAIGPQWFYSPQVGWTPVDPQALLPLTYDNGLTLTAEIRGEPLQPQPSPVYPDDCWVDEPKPQFQSVPDFLAAALMIQKVYANDGTVTTDLAAYLEPGATIVQYDNDASLLPGMVFGYDSRQCIVVMAGTTNNQQLATQIAYAGLGPVNFGQFSTNAAWYTASIGTQARFLLAGVPPTIPIRLIGHSYGGAICSILTAIYLGSNPDREIALLTMGMPRPGDARLAQILEGVPRNHLANFGDPVCALPPVFPETIPLQLLIPALLFTQWNATHKVTGQVIIGTDGTLIDDDTPVMLFALLLDCVAFIVANLALPTFQNHTIDEYVRRLQLATNP